MSFRQLVEEYHVDIAEEQYLSDLYIEFAQRVRDEGRKKRNTILDEINLKWQEETAEYPYLVNKFEEMIHKSERVAWIKWRKGETYVQGAKRLAENRPCVSKYYNNLQEKNRKLTQVNNDLREQLLEIDKFITEKAPELTRDGNTANSVKAFANYLGAHFTSAMNAYSQEIEGRLKEAESTIRRLDHDNSD
jgi:hypothetical protein